MSPETEAAIQGLKDLLSELGLTPDERAKVLEAVTALSQSIVRDAVDAAKRIFAEYLSDRY